MELVIFWFLAWFSFMVLSGTFAAASSLANADSDGVNSKSPLPSAVYRAVRPTR